MTALSMMVAALAHLPTPTALPSLSEPLTPTLADVAAQPSAAVRSAVMQLARPEPGQTVRIDLVCMASTEGSIFDCVPSTTGLPSGLNSRDFTRIAAVDEKQVTDHSPLGLARLQARRTVLRARSGGPQAYLVRLSETLDPAAEVALPAPTRTVRQKDLHISNVADAAVLSALYPIAASRNGTSASVTVQCRVQPDYSLFCHDGHARGISLRAGDAEDFVFATYQLMSTAHADPKTADGSDASGSDVELTTVWQLN